MLVCVRNLWANHYSQILIFLIYVNRNDAEAQITFSWMNDALIPEGRYTLRDLWLQRNVGEIEVTNPGSSWTGTIALHDNQVFRLSPINENDNSVDIDRRVTG